MWYLPPYSPHMPTSRFSHQTQAILFMLLAILCFSLMDVCAKILTQQTGLAQTLWARYSGQCLIVLALVGRRKGVWNATFPKLQFARSVMLLAATGFFFSGITAVGLAPATALMNVNPILVALGGALFLGEKLGPQRMIGILVSLIGALIIIRLGAQTFAVTNLLALAAAIFYAGYALATRHVGQREDIWTSLLYTGLVGGILTSLALPFFWITLTWSSALLMLVIGCVGTTGQLFLIRAFSKAEAGSIAPFSYVSLIYATIWGAIFFGTYPDFWTILGALTIASSGIFVWYRESLRTKQS